MVVDDVDALPGEGGRSSSGMKHLHESFGLGLLGLRLAESRNEAGARPIGSGRHESDVVTAIHETLDQAVAHELGPAVAGRRNLVERRCHDPDPERLAGRRDLVVWPRGISVPHNRQSTITRTVALLMRPITPEELPQFVAMLEAASGRRASDEVLEDARATYDVGRTIAAFDGDRIVAGTGSDLLELTVPGPRTLEVARLTHGGVLPTHRRRGLITALLSRQLQEMRERGEILAVMTTTSAGIYRRVGFSPATTAMEIALATGDDTLGVEAPVPERLRLVDTAASVETLVETFERHRLAQPGQISRTPLFWRKWLLDRPRDRKSTAGERLTVLHEDADGTCQGYVTYRLLAGHPLDEPVLALEVEDLVAVTEEARRGLWRYCTSFTQVASVTALNVPVDEPLIWMLSDPRRLRVTRLREFVWLRLVDVPAALARRRYAMSAELVLEVSDPVCPENGGRYRLEATQKAASCAATRSEPDLGADAADLAAVYLGGFTFTSLVRAGRVRELRAGAAALADALFASRPAPWTITDW